MTDQPTTREKPLPYWVGLTVYLALAGSLVLGIGYWLVPRLMRPPLNELDPVPAMPQVLASIGNPGRAPTGVNKTQGAGGLVSYTVNSTRAILTATKSDAQPKWDYSFAYSDKALLTPDQLAAANARYRLNIDPAFAKSLKVTDEQSAQLKQVPPLMGMMLDKADQAMLQSQFESYLSQPGSQAEQALVSALEEVATHSLPAARKNIAERVKQIQGILTAEQIKPFKGQ